MIPEVDRRIVEDAEKHNYVRLIRRLNKKYKEEFVPTVLNSLALMLNDLAYSALSMLFDGF